MKIKEKVNHLVKLIFNHLRPPLNFITEKELSEYLTKKKINFWGHSGIDSHDLTNKFIQAILNQDDIEFIQALPNLETMVDIDYFTISNSSEEKPKNQKSLNRLIYSFISEYLTDLYKTRNDSECKQMVLKTWNELTLNRVSQCFKKIEINDQVISLKDLSKLLDQDNSLAGKVIGDGDFDKFEGSFQNKEALYEMVDGLLTSIKILDNLKSLKWRIEPSYLDLVLSKLKRFVAN
jgi:hypothetical protein